MEFSAKNITKIYDSEKVPVQALTHVSLDVKKGEYIVLAGPSGSGKTTLLNCLGGLDEPTTGTVEYSGNNIYTMRTSQLAEFRLRHIGFIFQAYNLIPVLTARENIEFPMVLSGVSEQERRERAEQFMEILGIADLADKRPNEMSGGQQQRIAVARSVVNDPTVVLADEPTANLDTKTGAKLLELMQQLNEDKAITFIFSSHDTQVIDQAKRLIRIRDGQIESDT